MHRFMRFVTLGLLTLVAACATPQQRAAQAAADYGARCEKLGHAKDSEQWRACVQNEDMNAALATQRAYDREFLRKHDCVDPKVGCGGAAR
jgi:hypothetical protein